MFGEPRLDAIDDASAALSSVRERVRILAARLRMHLDEDDVAELLGILDDCDRAQSHYLRARSQIAREYRIKIGRKA